MSGEHKVGEPLPPKPVNIEVLEDGVRQLLIGLGQGDKPEVMKNTPRRMAEMFQDIINAPWCDIELPWKCFENPGVDDLIMITDCHYVSMCEHHLAPALGIAHFGYVPDKKITGYSKVKKGLNYISRQPQLNERLLKDTLDALESSLEPKGVGLILTSVHMCLVCKSNAPSQELVTMQGFRGCMRDGHHRSEFIAHALGRRPMLGPW